MAKQTSHELKNKVVYQVFTRQHSKTSDFKGIIEDLDRIKSLGVDIVYLLPFHPIGKKIEKGLSEVLMLFMITMQSTHYMVH
nr:hypothetical protein QOL21_03975 [Acholeplasma laidlawii]